LEYDTGREGPDEPLMREGVKGDKMKRQKRESDTDDAVVRYLGSCLAFMVLLRWFRGFDGVLACTLSRFAAAPVPLKKIQTSNNYLFPSLFAAERFPSNDQRHHEAYKVS
jgi:hypothetical protein